jgi:hypothetical protein
MLIPADRRFTTRTGLTIYSTADVRQGLLKGMRRSAHRRCEADTRAFSLRCGFSEPEAADLRESRRARLPGSAPLLAGNLPLGGIR